MSEHPILETICDLLGIDYTTDPHAIVRAIHRGSVERHLILKQLEALVAAIDTLNNNVTSLAAEIDKAVAKLSIPPAASEAQIQAAADAVAAQTARLAGVDQ